MRATIVATAFNSASERVIKTNNVDIREWVFRTYDDRRYKVVRQSVLHFRKTATNLFVTFSVANTVLFSMSAGSAGMTGMLRRERRKGSSLRKIAYAFQKFVRYYRRTSGSYSIFRNIVVKVKAPAKLISWFIRIIRDCIVSPGVRRNRKRLVRILSRHRRSKSRIAPAAASVYNKCRTWLSNLLWTVFTSHTKYPDCIHNAIQYFAVKHEHLFRTLLYGMYGSIVSKHLHSLHIVYIGSEATAQHKKCSLAFSFVYVLGTRYSSAARLRIIFRYYRLVSSTADRVATIRPSSTNTSLYVDVASTLECAAISFAVSAYCNIALARDTTICMNMRKAVAVSSATSFACGIRYTKAACLNINKLLYCSQWSVMFYVSGRSSRMRSYIMLRAVALNTMHTRRMHSISCCVSYTNFFVYGNVNRVSIALPFSHSICFQELCYYVSSILARLCNVLLRMLSHLAVTTLFKYYFVWFRVILNTLVVVASSYNASIKLKLASVIAIRKVAGIAQRLKFRRRKLFCVFSISLYLNHSAVPFNGCRSSKRL